MKTFLAIVPVIVFVACSSTHVAPSAATPTTAALTVHVNAEAFVTVIASTGRFGMIVDTAARFPDLPMGEPITVRASNNVGVVEQSLILTGDMDMTLSIKPPDTSH